MQKPNSSSIPSFRPAKVRVNNSPSLSKPASFSKWDGIVHCIGSVGFGKKIEHLPVSALSSPKSWTVVPNCPFASFTPAPGFCPENMQLLPVLSISSALASAGWLDFKTCAFARFPSRKPEASGKSFNHQALDDSGHIVSNNR